MSSRYHCRLSYVTNNYFKLTIWVYACIYLANYCIYLGRHLGRHYCIYRKTLKCMKNAKSLFKCNHISYTLFLSKTEHCSVTEKQYIIYSCEFYHRTVYGALSNLKINENLQSIEIYICIHQSVIAIYFSNICSIYFFS